MCTELIHVPACRVRKKRPGRGTGATLAAWRCWQGQRTTVQRSSPRMHGVGCRSPGRSADYPDPSEELLWRRDMAPIFLCVIKGLNQDNTWKMKGFGSWCNKRKTSKATKLSETTTVPFNGFNVTSFSGTAGQPLWRHAVEGFQVLGNSSRILQRLSLAQHLFKTPILQPNFQAQLYIFQDVSSALIFRSSDSQLPLSVCALYFHT